MVKVSCDVEPGFVVAIDYLFVASSPTWNLIHSFHVDIPFITAPGSADHKGSIGWTTSGEDFDSMMNRRSSSIGFNRSGSLGLGSEERRPFVGGGSAAAYEAARADHYSSMGGKGDTRGSLGMGGGMGGMTVNPNQHYEMLKLHHMNLLNEIQETTLMMNLYQQQQLQQQQEQLQRESGADASFGGGAGGSGASVGSKADELASAQQQQEELEERLRLIKEDIANRQKEADDEADDEKKEGGTKRKAEENDENEDDDEEEEGGEKKRAKTEKDENKETKGKGKKSDE